MLLEKIEAQINKLEEKEEKKKEYDEFFKSMLKKYGVKSPDELPKEKEKEFYDEVDKKWKAKVETD